MPWESRVSSMAEAGGFTGRNRCLLSAPVGLLCNNRPVTLRKCGEAACVCVCMCVCGTVFSPPTSLYVCVCVCMRMPELPASASSTPEEQR